VDWQSVLSSGCESFVCTPTEDVAAAPPPPAEGSVETKRYLRGEILAGGAGGSGSMLGASKNLLYELNSMQKLFRCLCSQWGIAYDMEEVIDQWISLCH
jgi:hypothetical protein